MHRCLDLLSQELVAVKCMTLFGVNAECGVARFDIEAESLALLRHDHIVRARDFGVDEQGAPFLVMDLVDGVLLNQIPSGALSFPVMWMLTDQLLGALEYAHGAGVVHGDLKPANVLVETRAEQPWVRLHDFGLAWHFSRPLDDCSRDQRIVSQPPPGCGTPGYMAPEQILGLCRAVGASTDLYALGCIVYRLLSGCRPIVCGSRLRLRRACLKRPSRPKSVIAGVPEEVVDFVMKLLNPWPSERAASTAQARAEWQRFRPELTSVASSWSVVKRSASACTTSSSASATTRVARFRAVRPIRASAH